MKSQKRPNRPSINMLSSAYKVKGQGVASAYEEQVGLVKENLSDEYDIYENKVMRADITHYHTIDYKYSVTMPFVRMKSKTVGYVHMIPETVETSIDLPRWVKRAFYWYMIKFYKSMDYLVTVNPYFIEKLSDYGVERERITYIPNFVSEQAFHPLPGDRKAELREKYGIPKDKFVALCVGQLQVRKGIFDFIEVAKRMPHVEFLWAGGFSFGSITDGYKQVKQIMEAPPANVKFLGMIERCDMIDIYNVADLMFLPSFEELFPMTVLESMCCGVPMLLRELEIYENILFDFYLRKDSVDGFVEEISKLAADKAYYAAAVELSEKGHKFYSREHVLAMWKAYYAHVASAEKKRRTSKRHHVVNGQS